MRRVPIPGGEVLKLLIFLLLILSLPACTQATAAAPTLGPDELVVPAAVSQQVGSFIRQTDGVFSYRMLRPANWQAADLVDHRGYTTPGYLQETDRMALRVVNLQVHYKHANTPVNLLEQLTLFEDDPSLDGWTRGIEQMWQKDGFEWKLLQTLPQAKIYAIRSPSSPDLQVIAYVVDQDQPLTVDLLASGAYADLERLQKDGILDDFSVMVASIHAIPRDTKNIDPALR